MTSPACEICNGVGLVRLDSITIVDCVCRIRDWQHRTTQQLRALSHTQPDPNITFEDLKPWGNSGNWATMARAIADLKAWVHAPSGWRLLIGTTGCGKSTLMAATYNQLHDRSAYIFASFLVRNLKQAIRTDSVDELIEQYQAVPILLIDDLGTEQLNTYNGQSEFVLAGLQDIMEYRYVYGKPTVVTTNLKLHELNVRYRRIASRLQEGVVHGISVGDYRTR